MDKNLSWFTDFQEQLATTFSAHFSYTNQPFYNILLSLSCTIAHIWFLKSSTSGINAGSTSPEIFVHLIIQSLLLWSFTPRGLTKGKAFYYTKPRECNVTRVRNEDGCIKKMRHHPIQWTNSGRGEQTQQRNKICFSNTIGYFHPFGGLNLMVNFLCQF